MNSVGWSRKMPPKTEYDEGGYRNLAGRKKRESVEDKQSMWINIFATLLRDIRHIETDRPTHAPRRRSWIQYLAGQGRIKRRMC